MIYVEKEKKKKRSYAEKVVERKVIKHILPVSFQNIHRVYSPMLLVIKGQLILKCPFVVFKSTKKTTKLLYLRISALASKKRPIKKSSVTESK